MTLRGWRYAPGQSRRYLLSIAWLCATSALLTAQTPPPTYIPQTKFSRGQDVVPSFDGWLRNADGTFTMVFGYMNRNYEEELAIPAGADNKLEPGPPDQGQPTYFLPRRHAWVLRVKVPADWGNRELVWTITSHGRTEKAYGSLQSQEEMLERLIQTRGNLSPGTDDPNKPPTIMIAPVDAASVGTSLALNALVTDDGLPKPRVPKPKSVTEPGRSQTNSATIAPRLGLNVTWMEYRGPAKVVFDSADPIPVKDGRAETRASFSSPGIYVLRAAANDGELSTTTDITINVSAGKP